MADDDKKTEIVKYEPAAALRHESWLSVTVRQRTQESKNLLAALNHAWPGDDLDPKKRMHRTVQLLEQAEIRISLTERPEAIRECCIGSVFDSLIACASMDLSIQRAFGESHLVPFKGVCTLMIGYPGFIKLLVNTGFVTHVESVLVYEGEEFTHWRDQHGPQWTHKPDLSKQGQAREVVGCYAVGYTRTGSPLFEYMNAAELEQVKQASAGGRTGNSPAYNNWPTQMMRKAPIRRLQKYIPKVTDNLGYELLAKAIEHDNRLFDLKGYEQAQLEYKAKKQAAKEAEWQAQVGQRPEGVDPDDPSTWEKADDGEPIPPNVGQTKERKDA